MRTAQEKFAEWVTMVGGDAAAAELLRCSRSFVFLVRKGQRKPGRFMELVIQEAAGIAPIEWQSRDLVLNARREGRKIAKRSVA